METSKKYNLAIFLDNKIIAVKVCRSEEERDMAIKENETFGFKTEKGFYHFNPQTKKMTWRGKGHSNRSKNAVVHEFDKKLIQNN
ncbi:TPA: hypothetical protein ACIFCT_003558 [Acinetobacter baumannii]|uniref:Uncharacterized protein n=1 Tax=Acinetobacter baumannii TaxID=470 RepID=A0A646LV20_ACIBA|nr:MULTISPECIES: hypothetical protein [Acinetobacter calcoaceticus/baumannii complex]EHU3033151.1 hypothetical protein [Acinetobacter baumannii]EHZ7962104.1 hypothetical protein [Acinetobacter baumannii]EIB7144057.1 hypothetical protein [Acinetobacter baumannii]EKA78394.1 hypothetical protein ACINIS58_A0058 [Acinetobacter baumannii IS-58]EKK06754.1 hypothetical protein ACINIS235_A0089 [Acinetobacter baumannii IS-235]